ncbi:MAG: hypothetical protein ABI794_16455, partial [Betaproteobacteria bacterium]
MPRAAPGLKLALTVAFRSWNWSGLWLPPGVELPTNWNTGVESRRARGGGGGATRVGAAATTGFFRLRVLAARGAAAFLAG